MCIFPLANVKTFYVASWHGSYDKMTLPMPPDVFPSHVAAYTDTKLIAIQSVWLE